MKKLLLVLALILAPVWALAAPDRLIINSNVSWSFTSFALNGSSQTLLAAQSPGNSARSGFIIVNPTGNATVYVDVSGGTASSTRGIPVPAGQWLQFTGQVGPYNAVTVIGTNGQTIGVYTAQ